MRMGVAVVDEWVAGMQSAFEVRMRETRDAVSSVRPVVCSPAGLPPSAISASVTPSSALSSAPYGDMPTLARSPSLSTCFTSDGGIGDFDFNFNGIFGQGFEFDAMESLGLMNEGTGGYDYEMPLSPATHTTALGEFI